MKKMLLFVFFTTSVFAAKPRSIKIDLGIIDFQDNYIAYSKILGVMGGGVQSGIIQKLSYSTTPGFNNISACIEEREGMHPIHFSGLFQTLTDIPHFETPYTVQWVESCDPK